MTLIDRLRATRDVPVVQRPLCAAPRTLISVVDKVYINPNGPEAATAFELMLEALEGYTMDCCRNGCSACSKARAAIAKVKEVSSPA